MQFPSCKNAPKYVCSPTGGAYSAHQNAVITITFCHDNCWKDLKNSEFFLLLRGHHVKANLSATDRVATK